MSLWLSGAVEAKHNWLWLGTLVISFWWRDVRYIQKVYADRWVSSAGALGGKVGQEKGQEQPTLGWNGLSRVLKHLTSVYCNSSCEIVQGGIWLNGVQWWSFFHIGLIACCPDPPWWAPHFYYIEQYWVKIYYDTRHQLSVWWSNHIYSVKCGKYEGWWYMA